MPEEQIILAEAGSSKKRLRISLSMFKSRPLLNIRNYFQNKDGEMQPTTKGISMTRNNYLVLSETIKKHNDDIISFMDSIDLSDTITSWSQRTKGALDSISAVEGILLDVKKVSGRDFSEVTYSGSKAQVSLNANHKYLKKNEHTEQQLKVLGDIAVAFDLATKLIVEDESNEVQHALERLRSEFSRQLQNLPARE